MLTPHLIAASASVLQYRSLDALLEASALRPGVTVSSLNDAANALGSALGGGNFTVDYPSPLVVQNGLGR